MCVKKEIIALVFVLLSVCSNLSAQGVRDSVKIHFRQGQSRLDLTVGDNKKALDRISDSLKTSWTDSIYILKQIEVIGGTSPEGSVLLNKRLSEKRANVLFDYLSSYSSLPDSLKTFKYMGRDWHGLLCLVEKDSKVPYREEVVSFLRDVAEKSVNGENESDRNLTRLLEIGNGRPYKYMYRTMFPELRASELILTYDKIRNPGKLPAVNAEFRVPELTAPEVEPELKPVLLAPHEPEKPFYMAVKTNMLFDALAVPDVGVEFYLGKNFSIAADWRYAWWKNDGRHRYWRIYGGDVVVRRWFGRAAKEKPLTGHHMGIYGKVFTYDFEWGGRGYMGGEPGGTLFDRCHYAAGIEYGYSLPVARRLNIDFTVGAGYSVGKYYEYLPIDNCYVWQSTRNRRYFGPTKLEVSLVWLLGRGNVNAKTGGGNIKTKDNGNMKKGGRR